MNDSMIELKAHIDNIDLLYRDGALVYTKTGTPQEHESAEAEKLLSLAMNKFKTKRATKDELIADLKKAMDGNTTHGWCGKSAANIGSAILAGLESMR